jgi:hypothetical protein
MKKIKNGKLFLRPDSKGRINLGDLSQSVSSYKITIGESDPLILHLYLEIPFTEKWIFDHKDILEKVKEKFKQKNMPLD